MSTAPQPYLLRNLGRVDKVHVEVVAKLGDASSDLVEGDTLLATIYR